MDDITGQNGALKIFVAIMHNERKKDAWNWTLGLLALELITFHRADPTPLFCTDGTLSPDSAPGKNPKLMALAGRAIGLQGVTNRHWEDYWDGAMRREKVMIRCLTWLCCRTVGCQRLVLRHLTRWKHVAVRQWQNHLLLAPMQQLRL